MSGRRLRLAMPFGIATERDCVHLIGGEDVRFSLRGPELEHWLPDILRRLSRAESERALLAGLPEDRRQAASALMAELVNERVLVLDPVPTLPACSWAPLVEGEGRLAARLRATLPKPEPADAPLTIVCQDDLNYRAARERCAELRQERRAHLWATIGPVARALVSPLFVPDASPCFECLLSHFLRLSPARDVTSVLMTAGVELLETDVLAIAERALALIGELVASKCALASEPEPSAALFRLHALELATLETSSHVVSPDPECAACR